VIAVYPDLKPYQGDVNVTVTVSKIQFQLIREMKAQTDVVLHEILVYN
jgi:hypothetical protein